MRKLNKILKMTLCSALTLSFAASVGCNLIKKEDKLPPVGGVQGGYVESDKTFIKNGRSEYTVLIPADATEEEIFAKEELIYFMELATGVKMNAVTDANYVKGGKYISLGRTKAYKETEYTADVDKYGESGYILKSDGNVVYISGADDKTPHDYGTIYGVYHFLKGAIDLEIYAVDCFDYDKSTTVKMPDYNVECVPDSNMIFFDYTSADATYTIRMRNQNPYKDAHYSVFGHSQTGITHLIPESVNHPEWFSGTGSGVETICYTQVDPVGFADVVIDLFEKNPGMRCANLGLTDMCTPCSCETCEVALQTYNTNQAGLQIMFLNKVLDNIYSKVTETEGIPLRIATFAYEGVSAPPVKLVEGKYVPDCPEVVPHENLYIWWAPVTTNMAYSFQSKYNEIQKEQYLGWCALTDNIDYYGYNYERGSFTIPAPSLITFGDNIEFFKSVGKRIEYFYEEGPMYSSFAELIVYVQSKMAWDNSLKYDDLAYDFIKHYYGPASAEMKEYYDLVKSWYSYNQNNLSGTCLSSIWKPSAYPMDILNLWLSVLDKAEQTLLASGPIDGQLQRYLARVHTEIFMTNGTKLGTYKSTLTPAEKEEICKRIKPYYDEVRFVDASARQGQTFDEWYARVTG